MPALSVAVAERLFTERTFNSTSHGIAEPDHDSQEDNSENKKQSVNH